MLSDSTLLAVWESGLTASPARRAVSLLDETSEPAAAATHADGGSAAALDVGTLEQRLLALRAAQFGATLEAQTQCPRCDAPLETAIAVRDLAAFGDAPSGTGHVSIPGDPPWELHFRLPTGADLLAAESVHGRTRRRTIVLRRCLTEVRCSGELCDAAQVPDAGLAAVAHHLAELHPLADLRVGLRCPDCDHSWPARLDIMMFLWAEVETAARQLLVDIVELAARFGWTEADVLALSPARRRFYLSVGPP